MVLGSLVLVAALALSKHNYEQKGDVTPFTLQEWWWAMKGDYLDAMLVHFTRNGGLTHSVVAKNKISTDNFTNTPTIGICSSRSYWLVLHTLPRQSADIHGRQLVEISSRAI